MELELSGDPGEPRDSDSSKEPLDEAALPFLRRYVRTTLFAPWSGVSPTSSAGSSMYRFRFFPVVSGSRRDRDARLVWRVVVCRRPEGLTGRFREVEVLGSRRAVTLAGRTRGGEIDGEGTNGVGVLFLLSGPFGLDMISI